MAINKGWRYVTFIGGITAFIGIAIYPIIISPMIDPTSYREVQKVTRKNIRQEDIQPGNMVVWSDPFGRKKSE